MPLQMASSDIVICRSGAATVSEISALGKASILVPSPKAISVLLSQTNPSFIWSEKYLLKTKKLNF